MSQLTSFVIMPYAKSFDLVYATVRAVSAEALPGDKVDCRWLKDEHAAGVITEDIINALQHASFCIADISGNNPNVMWETGFAMALGKPTILICNSLKDVPFDLLVHRVIAYDRQNLEALTHPLVKAIQQTLARYDVQSTHHPPAISQGTTPIIAVTGTMRADPARVRHRIRTLLRPYLSLDALWYCGTAGIVDECALVYLLENKQKVVPVAYNWLDFTASMRELTDKHKLNYIDASLEPLPAYATGPTERDTLFCTKADMVILLWDGISQGTSLLIEYYQKQAKNTLLGFI